MSNGDLWRTPQQVIDYIENRFGEIKLDLCASEDGQVCSNYITEKENFLDDNVLYKLDDLYCGSLCWMNPPYSNPLPFVKQAIKWSQAGYAIAGILNNDSSTKWFVELEKNAQLLMPITGGRIAFVGADGQPINGNNKPQIMFYLAPFGSHVKATENVNINDIYPLGKPSNRSKE
jgi:phage N-6-adenine-methyltransferase